MAIDGREWSAWEQTVKITGEYGGTVSPWAGPILHSFNKCARSPHDVPGAVLRTTGVSPAGVTAMVGVRHRHADHLYTLIVAHG